MTQEALDYSLAALDIEDADLRAKLFETYFKLDAFPEVPDMLAELKADALKTATLTNDRPTCSRALSIVPKSAVVWTPHIRRFSKNI